MQGRHTSRQGCNPLEMQSTSKPTSYKPYKDLQVMKYSELNPRHRKQAEKLAAAMFEVMTEPTELRIIIELHTLQDDGTPRPLHHYYMIDGAFITDERDADGFDCLPLPNGLMSVCGDFATDKPNHKSAWREVHPQAVSKWVLQMISRDRVRDIWAESY